MGSYIFERSSGWEGQASSSALAADIERALGELDWVDDFTVRTDEGEGGVVVADVAFDPDWPDTANPDLVAETFARYGLHIVDAGAAAGRVTAADPLRASDSVDDGGMDLFVFDEE